MYSASGTQLSVLKFQVVVSANSNDDDCAEPSERAEPVAARLRNSTASWLSHVVGRLAVSAFTWNVIGPVPLRYSTALKFSTPFCADVRFARTITSESQMRSSSEAVAAPSISTAYWS